MALDQKLLDILVCPETKKPLIYFEDEGFLLSPSANLKYPIEDDIPVMLVDEAEELSEEKTASLLETARERGLENAEEFSEVKEA